MTDIARKFRENPWEDITDDIFPKGKQLYQDDKRFFVSKKEGGIDTIMVRAKDCN